MPKFKQISSLFGGILLHLTIGSGNTYGNLNTYITSYLRKNTTPNLTYGHTVWVNAVGVASFTVATLFAGFLTRKIGARLTCLLGSLLFSGSIALTFLAVQYSFDAVLLFYGLLQNAGNGLIFSPVIVNCIRWFPDRRGFVSGLIISANCLSAVIFTEVQTIYLNPADLKPNLDGYFIEDAILTRVPQIFIVLSIIYSSIQIVALVLTFDAPIVVDQTNLSVNCDLNDNDSETDTLCSSTPSNYEACTSQCVPDEEVKRSHSSLKEIFKTVHLYILWLSFAVGTQGSYFIQLNKAFGETFIDDDQYLAIISSISFLINAIGGIVWGKLLDKLGFKDCICCIYGIFSAALYSFIISVYFYPKISYALWNFVIFFTSVGIWTCYLPEVSRKFGSKNAITIYGIIHTGPAIACIVFAPVFEWIINDLGWFVGYSTNAFLTTLSMLIIMMFYEANPLIKSTTV